MRRQPPGAAGGGRRAGQRSAVSGQRSTVRRRVNEDVRAMLAVPYRVAESGVLMRQRLFILVVSVFLPSFISVTARSEPSSGGAVAGVEQRRRVRRRHREAARDDDGVSVGGARTHQRSFAVAVAPVAQRRLALSLVAATGGPAAGVLHARVQRCGVEDDPGAVELADARVRTAHLHEHHLSLAAGSEGAAAGAGGQTTRSGRTARRSRVPAAWAGRQVLLHFDGVDSAFYVWVNGTKVGYNEDSRTPAEFDITPHLQPGRQPARGGGLPVQRRRLPRGPGHVAHVGDLPRRVPLVPRRAPRARLRGEDGPRRRVPRTRR